jgi:dolichol-phosphate mannosyltransferase
MHSLGRPQENGHAPRDTTHDALVLPKFLVVGGLGTLTNLIIFFVTVDLRSWDPTLGAVLGFVAAVTQNYLLNHGWTFVRQVRGAPRSLAGYARFVMVALLALGMNLAVLWAVLTLFDPRWKVIAQAVGIASGTAVNFLGSRFWVFAPRE